MSVKKSRAATVDKESKSTLISVSEPSNAPQDEHLYNEILDAILDQRLSPGVKLKEDELAGIFSVSRTVVRRALLRLSLNRVVDIQPNRSATVIRPDVRTAREVLGARRLIERELIREATIAATEDSIQQLKHCVASERDQVCQQHIGSGLRLSGDFHIQLSELADNQTLMGYLKELVPQTSLIIATYETPHHTTCAHDEHFEIIDIIAGGDVLAAQDAMDKHLQGIEDKLDLELEPSPDSLYAAFSHMKEPSE